jgi:galactokinase/mevalonate kinase-like predicted kinase
MQHAAASAMIRVSLPARINIVGSPTDAVEGAYATVSAAIGLRGGAEIGPAADIELQRRGGVAAHFARRRIAEHGGFAVEAAAINALLRYAPELGEGLAGSGFALQTWTDVPASSGLAGSSVLLLAVLTALRAFYGLDARRYNDYVMAEIAQRAEEHDLGVVCGFADRYVPLFGDIAYLSYHGKLWHAALGEEPFVTYEKLGEHVPALEFCVATTGVQRDSGSVHAPMRARYLEERQRGEGSMLRLARQLGETAWRGKIALLAGDLAALGAQINRNQNLVDEMMRLCGFASGAGDEVNLLVRGAAEAGALGAKLTGAGGGGAIFALPKTGEAAKLAEHLRAVATRAGLVSSEVFVLPVSRQGLLVTG